MTAVVATIHRDELATAIEAGTIVVLDAQGPGWFEREHLPCAIRARPEDLGYLEQRLAKGKDTPLIVYCWSESCVASALTAEYLVGVGYRDVRRYVGGKRDWIEAGLPIEGDGT